MSQRGEKELINTKSEGIEVKEGWQSRVTSSLTDVFRESENLGIKSGTKEQLELQVPTSLPGFGSPFYKSGGTLNFPSD